MSPGLIFIKIVYSRTVHTVASWQSIRLFNKCMDILRSCTLNFLFDLK